MTKKNPTKKECIATMNTIDKLNEKKAEFKADCEKHKSSEKCAEESNVNYNPTIAEKKKELSGCPKAIKKRNK